MNGQHYLYRRTHHQRACGICASILPISVCFYTLYLLRKLFEMKVCVYAKILCSFSYPLRRRAAAQRTWNKMYCNTCYRKGRVTARASPHIICRAKARKIQDCLIEVIKIIHTKITMHYVRFVIELVREIWDGAFNLILLFIFTHLFGKCFVLSRMILIAFLLLLYIYTPPRW